MAKKTEALRGKERIQQLMKEFPEIQRRQVILTDMHREGTKVNETLRQVGRWAIPDAPPYFERYKEDVHKTAERTEGYYRIPWGGYFGDGGRGFQFMYAPQGPYEVRYEERGRYRLYRDGEAIEEVFFAPRPQWFDRKTSSGKPMPSIISHFAAEDWLVTGASTYCEYFKGGDGCRFCNINPGELGNKEAGIVRLTTKRDQDLYETMVAACQERTQRLMTVSGGVFLDSSKEADNYVRVVRVLKRAMKDVGYEVPIGMKCQAMKPEDTIRLKEAGVTTLGFNHEVWDPKLFEYICPGKAKNPGREQWQERLLAAVEIFGQGRLVTSFMIGLELVPPYGFKTEDEGVASYVEGCEWALAHGILPEGLMFWPAPGAALEGLPSPRTEYFLRAQLARHKAYVKYGKAQRNPPVRADYKPAPAT